MKTLFVLNDAPYGAERPYKRFAPGGIALEAGRGGSQGVFLLGDAAACAKSGQKVPEGFYDIQLMLGRVVRNRGEIGNRKRRVEFRHGRLLRRQELRHNGMRSVRALRSARYDSFFV